MLFDLCIWPHAGYKKYSYAFGRLYEALYRAVFNYILYGMFCRFVHLYFMRRGGMVMTKRFSLQSMIEVAGCALFGFYILKLCLTNEFLFYLTPRMKPWLIFTVCVMFAWALSAAKTAFEADHYHVNLTSVFVLLIPLMLLLLPRKNVSIGDLSYAPQSGFSQGG